MKMSCEALPAHPYQRSSQLTSACGSFALPQTRLCPITICDGLTLVVVEILIKLCVFGLASADASPLKNWIGRICINHQWLGISLADFSMSELQPWHGVNPSPLWLLQFSSANPEIGQRGTCHEQGVTAALIQSRSVRYQKVVRQRDSLEDVATSTSSST